MDVAERGACRPRIAEPMVRIQGEAINAKDFGARLANRLNHLIGLTPVDRVVHPHAVLQSTAGLSDNQLRAIRSYFQHREKIDVSLSATTSWYGGDYMEFGACDLHTFRNMLSAFHIAALPERFPDTRFYAFDVFGKLDSPNAEWQAEMSRFDERTGYFKNQFPNGDDLPRHQAMIEQHGLFVDRCHLVQGFFEDTLSDERKAAYRAEGREIGFAFIDCNFEEFYLTVFKFIFDLMAPNSYIYMDEYFQSSGAAHYFDQFRDRLRDERGIECMYIRSAGGFGGLFRLRPVRTGLNFR